jgi:hypothetical protein
MVMSTPGIKTTLPASNFFLAIIASNYVNTFVKLEDRDVAFYPRTYTSTGVCTPSYGYTYTTPQNTRI